MELPKVYNVYFLAIISTVGGMLFGFDISSMSAIIGTEQYVSYFNDPHGIVQGAIGSSLAAGSVVGAAASGLISDKIGRRDAIFFVRLCYMKRANTQSVDINKASGLPLVDGGDSDPGRLQRL
ncbi:MAG: hypothetical protein Q9174_004028 [Haloplaca sp. 1 TL-2023]